jgi:hypothetical protein
MCCRQMFGLCLLAPKREPSSVLGGSNQKDEGQ